MRRRMLTYCLLSIAVFAFTTNAFGQNTVHGRVVDEMNQPISGANIIIRGTLTGTLSDTNGDFSLKIPKDTVDLFISHIHMEFKSRLLKITVGQFITAKLNKNKNREIWSFQGNQKPVKNENEFGTVTTYATDTINLEKNIMESQVVVWRIGNYNIFLPYDSILNVLERIDYKPNGIQFGLDYLIRNSSTDTVFLSSEFVEKVQEELLTDLSIRMLKEKSIKITDKKNKPIKSIIVRKVWWVGCSTCCWYGLEFTVHKKETTLFTITLTVC